jgi:LuxR family transcriptional regulator, maltose regulon positive regulatory protein
MVFIFIDYPLRECLMNEFLKKGNEALYAGEWAKAKNLIEKSLLNKESAGAFEALAWANWWLNDPEEVFDKRIKAYTLYLSENNKLAASRMASWIGVDYLEFRGELPVATGWFQRAENLLGGLEESPELALIKILKARLAFMVDKNATIALNLTEESLQLSKSLDYVTGVMIAEAFKGFILVSEGKVTEGMPLLDDATVLALTTGSSDVNMMINACCFLIDACELIRDYERAGQWCLKVKEICGQWNHKAMFASCRTQYASVLVWRGKWNEAEEELLSAAKELAEYRPLQVNSSIIRLADLRRRQGRWEEAEKLFDEVQYHSLKPLGQAGLFFDKGDYDAALNMAERFLRTIPPEEKAKRIEGLELILRIYIKLEKTDEASYVLKELEETEKTIGTLPIKAALLSAEGIFYGALKNYETAKQKFEDAIDIYDKIISPFEAARTRFHYADILIENNQLEDAETELNASMNIFRNLGAEKYLEKIESQLKSLNKKASAARTNIDFTKREREVLRLISEGKNNVEIAEELFVSIRTVEKHITNIYQKLGIAGKSARAFAAAYAIKNNSLLT